MLTYLFMLMTSWAIVCDVYYLEPTVIQASASFTFSIRTFYLALNLNLLMMKCIREGKCNSESFKFGMYWLMCGSKESYAEQLYVN